MISWEPTMMNLKMRGIHDGTVQIAAVTREGQGKSISIAVRTPPSPTPVQDSSLPRAAQHQTRLMRRRRLHACCKPAKAFK
jgi:hypothetical protein